MNIVSVVELQEPTLGRLLVSKLTVSVLSQARELLDEGLAADDFTSEFFSAQARRVAGAVPVSSKSHAEGEAIPAAQFKLLTPEARDRLAADYLSQNPPPAGSKSREGKAPRPAEPSTEGSPTERGTERLKRYVTQQRTWSSETADRMARIVRGETVGAPWEDPKKLRRLGLFGPSDEIARAMKHVSDLSSETLRILSGAAAPAPTYEQSCPTPALSYPKPQPDPAWEAVAQVSKMREDIASLAAAAQKQAELTLALVDLSKAIAKDSNDSLQLAVHSSKQAARATWLAGASVILTLLAILAALFVGRYSVNSTIANATLLGASAERRAQEEIRLFQEMANDLKTRANYTPSTAPNRGTAPKPGPSEKSLK